MNGAVIMHAPDRSDDCISLHVVMRVIPATTLRDDGVSVDQAHRDDNYLTSLILVTSSTINRVVKAREGANCEQGATVFRSG